MDEESNAREPAEDLHVLIVEDNPEQANLMRHGIQFHELKFKLEIVGTVQEAKASLLSRDPAILITELTFADGTANDLIPEDPETADYPVVILTDRGSEKDAVELLKAGVLDYIVKTRRRCQEIGDLVKNSLKSWNRIRSIRKAEVNLQQTLRLARSIMDSLPNPVGVLDENGKLLSVNESWRTGIVDPLFFGEPISVDLNYVEYLQNSEHAAGHLIAFEIRQVMDTQIANHPITFSEKGDDSTWYSVSVHPCQGSGRAKAIVIFQDISDRKKLEVNQSEKETAEEQLKKLTPREKQVMELVVGGKPNKSIARSLNISVKTVEMHRSNMMKKLKLRNVTDLVKLAVNAGTIQTEDELMPSDSNGMSI